VSYFQLRVLVLAAWAGSRGGGEVKNLIKQSSNFGMLLKALKGDKANLFLSGIFNVESGGMSVRTERFNKSTDDFTAAFRECKKCSNIEENVIFFSTCDKCLKSKENYFWLHAGDGDGVYAVFDILKVNKKHEEATCIGFMTVLYPTDEFAKPIVEHAVGNALGSPSPLKAFGFTVDLLEDFNDVTALESFEITRFQLQEESVFVSDEAAQIDSSYAVVRVAPSSPDPVEWTMLAFSEPVGEQLGLYPNDVNPRPRILIGMDSAWLAQNGIEASMRTPEGKEAFEDWAVSGVTSCHISPMSDVAIWFNYKINEAMEKLNYAASWLLQGAIHGDSDCINELSKYSDKISDPDWVTTWAGQRLQYDFANTFKRKKKLPFIVPEASAVDKDSEEERVTDLMDVCDILSALYSEYQEDERFGEFISFNDIGLPLAYMVSSELCELTEDGVRYIKETWKLFLEELGVPDIGYEDLESLLESAES